MSSATISREDLRPNWFIVTQQDLRPSLFDVAFAEDTPQGDRITGTVSLHLAVLADETLSITFAVAKPVIGSRDSMLAWEYGEVLLAEAVQIHEVLLGHRTQVEVATRTDGMRYHVSLARITDSQIVLQRAEHPESRLTLTLGTKDLITLRELLEISGQVRGMLFRSVSPNAAMMLLKHHNDRDGVQVHLVSGQRIDGTMTGLSCAGRLHDVWLNLRDAQGVHHEVNTDKIESICR